MDVGMLRWMLAVSLVVLVLMGVALRAALIEPGCSGRIVETWTALVRSDEQLAQIASADNAAKCPVYRERVSLLRTASSLGAVCGAPQFQKGEPWRNADAEARAYERLVSQACGKSGLEPKA